MRIKQADLKQLMALHELLSQSVLLHTAGLKSGIPDISPQDLIAALAVDETPSQASSNSVALLPEHREMARGLLLNFKALAKAGPPARVAQTIPAGQDGPPAPIEGLSAPEVDPPRQRPRKLPKPPSPVPPPYPIGDQGILGPAPRL